MSTENESDAGNDRDITEITTSTDEVEAQHRNYTDELHRLQARILELEGDALKTSPDVPRIHDTDRPPSIRQSLREGDFTNLLEGLLANAFSRATQAITTDLRTLTVDVRNTYEMLHQHIGSERTCQDEQNIRLDHIETSQRVTEGDVRTLREQVELLNLKVA